MLRDSYVKSHYSISTNMAMRNRIVRKTLTARINKSNVKRRGKMERGGGGVLVCPQGDSECGVEEFEERGDSRSVETVKAAD